MLTRLIPVVRSVGNVARLQTVRCMGGHAPAHWKTDKDIALENMSHMNSMPVPEGSWQDNHSKRNSKWTMQLGASIVLLLATIVAMKQTQCVYLHDTPPMKKK